MVRRRVAVCFALVLASLGAERLPAQQIVLVSPALPTTADQVTVFVSIVACNFRISSQVQGNIITITTETLDPCPPGIPPDPGGETQVTFGPLPPGSYTMNVVYKNQTTDTRALFVGKPSTQLSLFKGRFAASVILTNADVTVPGQAVQVSDSSGYFWFFDKDNVEITIKMVDAITINGHFWVFVSSGTDQPFTLLIFDTWLCESSMPRPGCPSRTYQGVAGLNANFIDFSTFAY